MCVISYANNISMLEFLRHPIRASVLILIPLYSKPSSRWNMDAAINFVCKGVIAGFPVFKSTDKLKPGMKCFYKALGETSNIWKLCKSLILNWFHSGCKKSMCNSVINKKLVVWKVGGRWPVLKLTRACFTNDIQNWNLSSSVLFICIQNAIWTIGGMFWYNFAQIAVTNRGWSTTSLSTCSKPGDTEGSVLSWLLHCSCGVFLWI